MIADKYARDFARISSTLLSALIALMTFLLIVGLQSQLQGFTTELYVAIILLGISLVLFAAAHIVRSNLRPLKLIRLLQPLVFVASVVAVVWFVISYAQLVVKPPQTQQQGGPAAEESAEDHAAETAPQQQ